VGLSKVAPGNWLFNLSGGGDVRPGGRRVGNGGPVITDMILLRGPERTDDDIISKNLILFILS
jgi:hypothetical protein